MVLFKRLEIHWRSGSWCRPDEWVWDWFWHEECLLAEFGFVSVAWHKSECSALYDKYIGEQ